MGKKRDRMDSDIQSNALLIDNLARIMTSQEIRIQVLEERINRLLGDTTMQEKIMKYNEKIAEEYANEN